MMYDEPDDFKIATGYERMAIELANYVNNYVPSHWKKSIRSVMSSVSFQKEDAKAFFEMFTIGILWTNLQGYNGWLETLKNPNVHRAIVSFFEEDLHLEALEEVDLNEKISDKHLLFR